MTCDQSIRSEFIHYLFIYFCYFHEFTTLYSQYSIIKCIWMATGVYTLHTNCCTLCTDFYILVRRKKNTDSVWLKYALLRNNSNPPISRPKNVLCECLLNHVNTKCQGIKWRRCIPNNFTYFMNKFWVIFRCINWESSVSFLKKKKQTNILLHFFIYRLCNSF